MPARDDAMNPTALDHLWDAMNRQIAPVGGRTASASIAAAETIRQLADHDDAPQITDAQIEAIWTTVATATLPADTIARRPAPAMRSLNPSIAMSAWKLLQSAMRQIAIGALAGLLVGMVVIGGGSRMLMRIAALLAREQTIGTQTENGNTVGQISLDGTLALIVFVGIPFGVLGGIALMTVRPWLPARGWQRYVASGLIAFAVAGPIVLEGGENRDYERFGILGLNICLFTMLPFLFGVAIVPVVDALDRRISPNLPGISRGWPDLVKSTLMIPLILPVLGLIAMAFAREPVGLLILLPVLRVLLPVWSRHAPSLGLRQRRERIGLQVGQAALLIPCLLGLGLMAQSIARLVN